jgi:ATP-dependent helicase/nuclease subunit B
MAQCHGLLELLKVSELSDVPAPMLQRLLHDATAAAPRCPRARAEAGLHFVASPDGVLGPCDTVVWWGFTRASAPAPRRSPFRSHEHRELAEAGVTLPGAGDQALRNAERWNRPLLQCSGQLILVCPEVGLDGEALEVHPLWDEICSRMDDDGAAAGLVKDDLAEQLRVPAETRALPSSRHQWSVSAELIKPRKLESPSSLEKYLGCPLSWVLHYGGKVRPGESVMLTVDNRLLGSLVHEIVATVLGEAPWPSPEQAGDRADVLFDEMGPARAAQLFQPEWARERAHARLAARASVSNLLGQLNDAGLVPERVEQSREAQTFVGAMAGTADLVAGPSPVVIDLKWGGLTFRRQSLAKGSALQLSAYGELESVVSGGAAPEAAYFILRSQRLLTTSTRFPGAEQIVGPSPRETWLGAERAWRTCWAETERGLVRARGVPDPKDSSQLAPEESSLSDEGVLKLTAGCKFCHYSALCGREVAR